MTVTFTPIGRLGNFLFKAATTIAYALDNKIAFSFPSETNNQKWNPIYFPKFQTRFGKEYRSIMLTEREFFKYEPLPFNSNWACDIVLDGYFQNPKYFQHRRNNILSYLRLENSFGVVPDSNKNVVAVHVRRGDYLSLPDKHIVPSVEWYKAAMDRFPYRKFMFFSDDIDWCEDNFKSYNCEFSREPDELRDLCLMSQCAHFICSSSTFAWWGAWLSDNPNKIVILPKQWMQPGHTNQWTEEIVPNEWQRL